MNYDEALLAHIAIPPKLLVALIVLGLALIIWAIVAIASSGKKQQQHVAPNSPMCTTCGSPGRWNYNAWVCDRCQRPIMPGMQPGMAPPQQMVPQAAPGGPSCTTCGSPGRWIPESNGWGCDRCRQMIGPAMSPPA